MASSFNGHSFAERGSTGYNVPRFDTKVLLVIKKIPGSNDNLIQKIGDDVRRLAMPIQCSEAELGDLEGDRGDVHLLDWSGGTTDAILEAIDTPIEVIPGKDIFQTVLHFIKQ